MQTIKFVLVFWLLFKQSFDAFFSHTLTPEGQGRRIDRRLMLKVGFAAEVSPIRILDPHLNWPAGSGNSTLLLRPLVAALQKHVLSDDK